MLRKYKGRIVSMPAAVGTALAVSSMNAMAAVPASVATSFTEMSDDFETIFGYGFSALTVVVVAMIAWRYTKKLGNKI